MEEVNARKCAQCGAPLDLNLTSCKYCGEPVAAVQQQQYQAPMYQQQHTYQENNYNHYDSNVSAKSKTTAGILAILLGGIGIHKFYLGKIGIGIIYILFCWTYIPAILGIIEGITYLTASDEKFYQKYAKK